MNVSVIYPVHITFSTRYILKRLGTCLNNTCQGLLGAEHIIALSGLPRYVKKAKLIIRNQHLPITIIDYPNPTTPYSPGIARNFAVKHTNKDNLLFWDIDLLGSQKLFKNIPILLEELAPHPNRFEIFPCLYLCQEYTKYFKGDLEQAWFHATNLKVNSIEHFAMATSTILCNKQHFLNLGAFDEEFIGHMGEDLELLNRLAVADAQYPFEKDHCENHPSKVASELKGFRKHFLNYSVTHLKLERFTVHLHHSTHIGSAYKVKNKKNLSLLLDKLSFSINTSKKVKKFESLPFYLTTKPCIKIKSYQRIKNKTRKLILKPAQFIKDIQ